MAMRFANYRQPTMKSYITHRPFIDDSWSRLKNQFHWLLFIVLLFPFDTVLAQEVGEMVSVVGSAEVLRQGRWQPIRAGEPLTAGETVRTRDGSRAAILLSNGTQIKLNDNSQLELKQVAPREIVPTSNRILQSILRLLEGEIWVRDNNQSLEIQTLPATATIRGTEFNLAVAPAEMAHLAVLDGLVELSNPQGSVLVAANEQAQAKVNEAPHKTVLLNPLDAVQWSLYYPQLIDPQDRRNAHQNDPSFSAYWVRIAQEHLLRGQVPEARQAIDRALSLDSRNVLAYSLRSTIELVQNHQDLALADAERAVAADPTSSAAYLSLSLARQAQFELQAALAAAQEAVELDPNNARALIQQSSLLFGMGRQREALKVAKRARQRAPDDAMVNTVWGFLQLARNDLAEAQTAFQTAIAEDSTLGLPQLGLGLVLFRYNHDHIDAAIAAIRKATLLEPKVSLYNSYLGKAFYEAKRDRFAQKYLEAAKQLDPRDPTPWLYDAIRLQSVNRPVEAVENLQKSIALNDNRGVYRSRLLLDEDLAARSATLGRIYNEVGFTELGLREGWQSISRDPSNSSAHRLLADSYAAFPDADTARASELLQAQLLQPINITPVSPRMAETKLLFPPNGPLTASLYEFNPLMVQDRPSLYFSGLVGNQSSWGEEVMISGMTERSAYSFGQLHYQDDGYRSNNDLSNNLYNLFVQTAVTPEFNLQAEYRQRETSSGDLNSLFDGSFSLNERHNIEQKTARVGARYTLSPQTTALVSVIHTDRDGIVSFKNNDFYNIRVNNKGTQAETQLLYKTEDFNLITGLGAYSLDNTIKQYTADSTQRIAYSYANIKLLDPVTWTIGLSYETDKDPSAHLNELNPKLGLQWAINDQLSLRAAAFKTVKRNSALEQSIEPTQIAGFTQLTDRTDMTVLKNYGAALDFRVNDRLWGGLEALKQDSDAPLGQLSVPEYYEIASNQEYSYGAYGYWLPNHYWALSIAPRYEIFKADRNCFLCLFVYPAELKTFSLPVNVRYFDPSGFFSGLGIVYVNQDIQAIDLSSAVPGSFRRLPSQNENFTLVNVGLGYRFPKRWGVFTLQIDNVFDRNFYYQDDNYQTGDGTTNPLYIPERTLRGRLILNF